jgi:hypothetical protein
MTGTRLSRHRTCAPTTCGGTRPDGRTRWFDTDPTTTRRTCGNASAPARHTLRKEPDCAGEPRQAPAMHQSACAAVGLWLGRLRRRTAHAVALLRSVRRPADIRPDFCAWHSCSPVAIEGTTGRVQGLRCRNWRTATTAEYPPMRRATGAA